MHRYDGHTHSVWSSVASEGGGEEGHEKGREGGCGGGGAHICTYTETAQRVEVQDEGASGYLPMQAYTCKQLTVFMWTIVVKSGDN